MTVPARLDIMKKSPISGKDENLMRSWTKRELALAVLVIFAAPAVPYVIFRLLGELLSLSHRAIPLIGAFPSLFLYVCISALVAGFRFSSGPGAAGGSGPGFWYW